jgi:hypothetical protein
LRQPIVEDIFSGAANVVTNLDHVSIVTYKSQDCNSTPGLAVFCSARMRLVTWFQPRGIDLIKVLYHGAVQGQIEVWAFHLRTSFQKYSAHVDTRELLNIASM